MKVDLKKLSAKELDSLQSNIQAELSRKKQEQKREVVKEVKALLAKYGMTLDDLPGRRRTTGKTKTTVAPKYQDKKSGKTWTGRGRKPKWVADHLAKGGKLADLAIK